MNLTLLFQSSSLQEKVQKIIDEFIESVSDVVEHPIEISTDSEKPADMFITDYTFLQNTGPDHFKSLKSENPGSKTMVLHQATEKNFAEDCFNADADYMIDSNVGIDLIPEILNDLLNKIHTH